jgi:FkbM family methyltransferase
METNAIQTHAQFGEDVAVLEHFGENFKGVFVEVGAFMPDTLSQTYLLEQNGWVGILVEPQPDRCQQIAEKRSARVYQVACGSPDQAGSELMLRVDGPLSKIVTDSPQTSQELIPVKMRTLDSLLEESGFTHVHFLSIDTEGFELNVLKGFSIKKYSPELIIIEDEGESLANYRHLVSNGYRLVKRTGCNDWYLPQAVKFDVPLGQRLRLSARLIRAWVRGLFKK